MHQAEVDVTAEKRVLVYIDYHFLVANSKVTETLTALLVFLGRFFGVLIGLQIL